MPGGLGHEGRAQCPACNKRAGIFSSVVSGWLLASTRRGRVGFVFPCVAGVLRSGDCADSPRTVVSVAATSEGCVTNAGLSELGRASYVRAVAGLFLLRTFVQ